MKTLRHFPFKRIGLALFTLAFTSITITGQASAFDKQFFAGNDIDFYDPTCSYSGGSGDLSGSGEEEKIWNFLVTNGLSEVQAAGVMGNMQAESGFVPTRHQSTQNVYTNGGSGNAWGLVQWDGGRRYTAPNGGVLGKLAKDHPELKKYTALSYDYARNKGAKAKIPDEDLNALLKFELTYLEQESKSRPVTASGFGRASNEWETLKLQKSVNDATVFWHNNFEVSADSASRVISTRGGFAKAVYDKFAGKTTPTDSGSGNAGSSSESSAAANAPVIYLDPGNTTIAPYTDTRSGLKASESFSAQQGTDALDVANRAKSQLTKDGYKVVMSRTTNGQKIKFRDRADAAAAAKASVGVSIYTTNATGDDANQVWPQRVGTYRQSGSKKDTFTNQTTAQKSTSYAENIAKTRTDSEGHSVTTDPNNSIEAKKYAGSSATGNTPFVNLWSPSTPWVYNEIAQDANGGALSNSQKTKYAKGIADGIEAALPIGDQTDSCGNPTFDGGDLAQTVLAYAWPTYKGSGYMTEKPSYAAAIKKAKSEGRYVGDCSGVDCGGFVTTLMIDSGFEPKYNYSGKGGNTISQQQWLNKNWQKLPAHMNVADRKPGDVAINSDHTYVYVGSIPGFATKIASASQCDRAPMAGTESATDDSFSWYRKK